MTAEQKVIGLNELKRRIEKLLAYYREDSQREPAFVRSLEGHLKEVCRALETERATGFPERLVLSLAA
jgi:hypothetical protein